MTLLLLAGIVQASDLVETTAATPASAVEEIGASRDGGGSSDGGKKKKKKKQGDDTADSVFDKGKLWGWGYRPYVTPGGGVAITDGGTSVSAGADVGIRYWKKNWKGNLAVGGSYLTGDVLNGYDIHAGNEFGRREKYWGLTAGLIGFYNGFIPKEGAKALDPSMGIDVPVDLIVGPKKYYAYGNITPSFLFNEARRVETLPFGDELEWGAGVGVNLKWITAELGFNQRITTIGTINTPTLTLQVSGLD
jgi:hypothetical protein